MKIFKTRIIAKVVATYSLKSARVKSTVYNLICFQGCQGIAIQLSIFYFKNFFGSVVEWLKRRAYDQHDPGSKPTRAILLCPWEKHCTALSPACWPWQSSSKLQSYLY